jgi:hypothetical protein
MVEIDIDPKQLAKLQRVLASIKDGVPKVLAPAINRALDSGRTVVKREIRKVYEIKAKDIPVNVHRAYSAKPRGDIELHDHMLDLGKFKVVPNRLLARKRVIHATVRKGKGGPLPGAFHTTLPYVGPYVRKGKTRLPIKKLLAISAPIMASQPSVGPEVNTAMGDTLAKRIDHEIQRVLAKEHT